MRTARSKPRRSVCAEHPQVGVLSQYGEPHHAMQLLQDAASGVGYLLKDRVANVGEVVEAVHRVAGGGSVASSVVGKGLDGSMTCHGE
jgi:DNA-binding NarL/FixJ family response regulator